jgi:hypothetical protein
MTTHMVITVGGKQEVQSLGRFHIGDELAGRSEGEEEDGIDPTLHGCGNAFQLGGLLLKYGRPWSRFPSWWSI